MTRVLLLSVIALALAACKTSVEPPAVGDVAPGFLLVSNEGTEVDLADHRGQWVVLYFYPKNFTSGCTTEARNFQRDLPEYEARNAVILGVSTDDADSHADFCAQEGLSFKLLADTKGIVSEAYGSVREAGPARVAVRNTFVIDPEGRVAQVYLGVDPETHSETVLTDLGRLQGA